MNLNDPAPPTSPWLAHRRPKLTAEELSSLDPLRFGFDIGIASVGWAVLSPTGIVDLGVRCFEKAETAKEGEPLNLSRRQARLMRRRLRRRAWRLTKLARCLKRQGLVEDGRYFQRQPGFEDSAWTLRDAARTRKLDRTEWARVIYHLCKHRGFHWRSKAEAQAAEGEGKSEAGQIKKALNATQALMQEKGYETAAQMVLAEYGHEFLARDGSRIRQIAPRNKQGCYDKALSRVLLEQEFRLLFERQRQFGNPYASAALEIEILGNGDRKSGLFWQQKPALSGEALLRMLGRCTFEREEYRAPKSSFTAERHVWLTRLNNLRIQLDGRHHALDEKMRLALLDLPYLSGEKFTYKHVRRALIDQGLPEQFRFVGLSYPSEREQSEEKAKDPESEVLIKLTGWHELRLALKRAHLESVWDRLACEAMEGKPETLDQIAWILTVYKEDDEVERELRKLELPEKAATIQALMTVRFDQFHALSLKALRQIVPLMAQGMRYDEAVAAIPAYADHSRPLQRQKAKQRVLPSLYRGGDREGRLLFNPELDVPRNPVVLRALNQARKVLNALVRTYGPPAQVNIEMARDLSRPLSERTRITKLQEAYRERNERAREQFKVDFGRSPSGAELEKWLLCKEQHDKCAYSLNPLDLNRVIDDPSYAEIDHALPYSRSFDDSKNNRVLVLKAENQRKGNRTPYEYLTSFPGGEQGERWRNFVAFVEGNKAYRQAKRSRLLRKDFSKEAAAGFVERNLNDTRYICRFFKNWVERDLAWHPQSEGKRCVVLNGAMTDFLRRRWGLLKVREESDRHHALDAVVVAASNHAMVKRIADYSRRKELAAVERGFVDLETGEVLDPPMYARLEAQFPNPWPHFRDELIARLKTDEVQALRQRLSELGVPPLIVARALPLFVSRAPQRRSGGAAHKETIYAQPPSLQTNHAAKERVPLNKLSLKDLDRLVDPERNEKLYAAIRERLEAFGGKADKAFTPENPLRKPDRFGQPNGPIVTHVRLKIDKITGVRVRGGIAKNGSMLRVDIFQAKQNGKYFLVPVYVHHIVSGLPNLAITARKPLSGWTIMDNGYLFVCTLHANDLIQINLKNHTITGYYNTLDISDGSILVYPHDSRGGASETWVGIKNAIKIRKLNIDALGNIYPAPPEVRRGLA